MRAGRQRVIVFGSLTLAIVVLCIAAFVAQKRLREQALIRRLDSTDPAEPEQSARRLAAMGSLRALPDILRIRGDGDANGRLADEVLDEIRFGREAAFGATLCRALREGEKDIRRQATEWLYLTGPEGQAAVPALLDALEDEDVRLRIEATKVLWKLGVDGEVFLAKLLEALDSKLQGVRHEATVVLEWVAEDDPASVLPALPVLIDHLRRDITVNTETDLGGVIGFLGAGAVPRLVELLADHGLRGRRWVARILAGIGPQAAPAVPALLGAIADEVEEEEVRRWAIIALGAIGTEASAAVPALVGVLERGSLHLRWEVVDTLAQIGPAAGAAISALLKSFEDPDRELRLRVVDALGRLCPDLGAVLPALVRTLQAEDVDLRVAAVRSLGSLGADAESALPFLRESFRDSSSRVRVWAMCAAVALRPEEASILLPQVLAAFQAPKAGLRVWDTEALGRLGPLARPMIPDLVPMALLPMHSNEATPARVRVHSRFPHEVLPRALREIGMVREDFRPLIEDLRERGDDRVEILFRTLGEAGAPAVPDLVELLKSSSTGVQLNAARILYAVGPEARDAVPGLRELLRSKDRWIRMSAWSALRRIAGRKNVFKKQTISQGRE